MRVAGRSRLGVVTAQLLGLWLDVGEPLYRFPGLVARWRRFGARSQSSRLGAAAISGV